MSKLLVLVLFALPVVLRAQIPIPTVPDWLRPAQNTTEVLTRTEVSLSTDNYVIVEPNVVARSRGFKLLGLITFRSPSASEAMSRLYEQAHIQRGRSQALANVIYESRSSYYILFSVPTVTIRADLIEFFHECGGEEPLDEPRPALLRAR